MLQVLNVNAWIVDAMVVLVCCKTRSVGGKSFEEQNHAPTPRDHLQVSKEDRRARGITDPNTTTRTTCTGIAILSLMLEWRTKLIQL